MSRCSIWMLSNRRWRDPHVPWLPKTELQPVEVPRSVSVETIPTSPGSPAGCLPASRDGSILGSDLRRSPALHTADVWAAGEDQLGLLPLPPLAAFFLLLIGGYFVLLTAAGGQMFGKMAAGIRSCRWIRPAESFGHSAVRAAAYLVSVMPVGLGLVPALVHSDRRALHDRLADTRVVKA